MNYVRFSTQVFVVGVILSLTFFLLLIDSFKTYRSETSILVVAKSEIAAKNEAQLLSNMLEFPKTLSFYDALLKNNTDVRDVTVGLSADQRKKRWNEMLSVERASANASVIKISITAKNQNDAQQLNQKTVRTLFNVVSLYYDVKNDVDLRIVYGPIVKSQVLSWQLLLAISIGIGFLVAAFLQLIFFGKKRVIEKDDSQEFAENKSFFDFKKQANNSNNNGMEFLDELYKVEENEAPFVFEQRENNEDLIKVVEDDLRVREMKKLTKQIEPDKYPNFPELPAHFSPKASAPDNLPIADDFFATDSELSESVIEEKMPVEKEEILAEKNLQEPTPEELKRRLNQLLRGQHN